ncbi:MAG: class II fumarate hydratase [Hyphomicrobiales bacterium]|nr:class II fumarate hydratase [Hyphomicrobiales bacterium]
MMARRIEKDTFGEIEVDEAAYWGAQTERSLRFFAIGSEKQPVSVIHALALIKRCAASVNRELGLVDARRADAIIAAARAVESGALDDQFPLSVWQTGSGTQTNMNVNEVIANRANEMLGAPRGAKNPVHPNDHVNLGQSSNDTYPSAAHIAAVAALRKQTLPALQRLQDELSRKAQDWRDLVKIGRTHLQDAVPMTLGQEFSGYAAQTKAAAARIEIALEELYALAQGGTAVGTGLNAPDRFGERVVAKIAQETGEPFVVAPNPFAALADRGALLNAQAAMTTAAASLFKIANDIRLLGSGPRAGLGELALPENEPGSSIMPGKVNPTQSEALTQVCAQIAGANAAVAFAGGQGHLELSTFTPMIIFNVLNSARLLGDAVSSFAINCVHGLAPRLDNLQAGVERSLMLATALAPRIGYDAAAKIARAAHESGGSLKAAAVASGLVTEVEFDELCDPRKMLGRRV